jgi:4a-hydroxytetrahydrobiopterin dehydratase
MRTMFKSSQLSEQHCFVLDNMPEAAYSASEIDRQLIELAHWQFENGFIARKYVFANYYKTIAFVNSIAWQIHTEDHHPELLVTYSECLVKFNTHAVGGISINDFICAAQVNAIFARGEGGR